MKKTLWIVGIIIVLLIIVAAASRSPKEASGEPIKIGVIAPLTGARADAGEYIRNALVLAQEDIEKSSRRNSFEFVVEDSKYEAPTAISAYRKLVDFDGVKYIVGPYGSSEVMAVGPVAEEAKVVLLLPGAQSDEISALGDYIFRIIHHSAQEAPVFAKFIAEKMKGDTLHFLLLNTAITEPYLKVFTPAFENSGKKIGFTEKYDVTTTDFRAGLLKIKNLEPSDIFLIATPKHAALILEQARELGITAQFYNIGVEGPELLTTPNGAAEGLLYPYSYDNRSDEKTISTFNNAYLSRFGTVPDTVAANAYDAAMLLVKCINRVGDDVTRVKDCLYETKEYAGASGTFSIDENGDAIKTIIIKTIKNSQFVAI
ncbi:MAG: ABC transporter substrate-binding protein [Patescibacteria group bacterium]